MKRGEAWTISAGGCMGKPRPAVIVQDDRFDASLSVRACAFTTEPTDAPLFRPVIEPSPGNGLRATSRLMADKITTISKDRLGARLGRLEGEDVGRLDRAILLFLGLAK